MGVSAASAATRRPESGATASWCGSRASACNWSTSRAGLDANDLLVLGEPELKAPLGLDVFHVELVWPARGLAAHVSEDDGTVRALYAFAPMDGEGYMAWLGAARGPRRVR